MEATMVQYFKIKLICFFFVVGSLVFISTAQCKSSDTTKIQKKYQHPTSSKKIKFAPISPKKVKLAPISFRVKKVTFKEISVNLKTHLAVIIEFNKPVKASSVVTGTNCRVLKEDNGFWIDAYPTAGSNLRVVDRYITWAMGSPVNSNGPHKVHLRGTIKATSGEYMDCNNDGKGEGGSLPAYNSQIYHPVVTILQPILTD